MYRHNPETNMYCEMCLILGNTYKIDSTWLYWPGRIWTIRNWRRLKNRSRILLDFLTDEQALFKTKTHRGCRHSCDNIRVNLYFGELSSSSRLSWFNFCSSVSTVSSPPFSRQSSDLFSSFFLSPLVFSFSYSFSILSFFTSHPPHICSFFLTYLPPPLCPIVLIFLLLCSRGWR